MSVKSTKVFCLTLLLFWASFQKIAFFFSKWANFLKAHWQISKKGVSKSIVHVIKHANFQLYRVQSYLESLRIGDKFINKRVWLFIHQTMRNLLRRKTYDILGRHNKDISLKGSKSTKDTKSTKLLSLSIYFYGYGSVNVDIKLMLK